MIDSIILALLADDRVLLALIVVLAVKVFSPQLISLLPTALQKRFDAKAKLEANKQEFERQAALAEQQLKRLERMTELSSSTFVEQQVTQFTAESQTQLNEANSFIRQKVSDKLDILIEVQQSILREVREIKRRENGGNNGTKKLEKLD